MGFERQIIWNFNIPKIKAKELYKTEAHNVNYSIFTIKAVLALPSLDVLVDNEAVLWLHWHVWKDDTTVKLLEIILLRHKQRPVWIIFIYFFSFNRQRQNEILLKYKCNQMPHWVSSRYVKMSCWWNIAKVCCNVLTVLWWNESSISCGMMSLIICNMKECFCHDFLFFN